MEVILNMESIEMNGSPFKYGICIEMNGSHFK